MRKAIIITLFLLCLLMIGAVSAAENTTKDVVSSDVSDDKITTVDDAGEETSAIDNSIETKKASNNDAEIIGEGEYSPTSFAALRQKINDAPEDSEIELDTNYAYNETSDSEFKNGIHISKSITINGKGKTIDGNSKARIFNIQTGVNVIIKNLKFTNSYANIGGAIYNRGNLAITNCIFTQNSAEYGGAITSEEGNVIIHNGTFINNIAQISGGANYFKGRLTNALIYGNFKDNVAESGSGGANYFLDDVDTVIIIGDYSHNIANSNCNGSDKSGSGGANCFNQKANNVFISGNYTDNVGYRGGANFFYKDASNVNMVGNYTNNIGLLFGGANYFMNSIINATISGNYTNNKAPNCGGANYFNKLANNVMISGDYIGNSADGGSALYFNRNMNDVSIFGNFIDNQGNNSIHLSYRVDSTLTVSNIIFDYNSTGSCEVSFTGATGIEATVVNQSDAVVNIIGNNITVSGLDAGIYTLAVTTIPDEEHDAVTKNVAVIVNKLETELSASEITTTYNVNKDLVITLKDSKGNPVSGVNVIVNLNGNKVYTTDKDGQIKVSTEGLAPDTYIAEITFNGTANYAKATKSVKLTVKKATPKMTAKTKTFKKSVKTKKYIITLKTNQNKVLKNANVTIKVNKKTYTAKTNSKGVATFKITKLTKKGKYTAIITYKGSTYYNKLTKKVKISVK